jgi:hypothetical protein
MTTPASDPGVPLCFDTSAVRDFRGSAKFLVACRRTWPKRRLLVPAVVVAEQVRHWMLAGSTPFNGSKFASFLENYSVPGFDKDVALDGWHPVLSALRPVPPAPWPWRYDETPAPLTRSRNDACAHVCRWPDHAIQAIAICHRALLVTDDGALLAAMTTRSPGAVGKQDIEALVT